MGFDYFTKLYQYPENSLSGNKNMILSEIYRLYLIVRVILSYGLDEILPQKEITLPIRIGRYLFFWMKNKYPNDIIGKRVRLALQELGPVWIKFGQMLSTRRDLLSTSIADQLSLLQDRVKPFEGASVYIERSISKPIETWFNDFQHKPLASASIAQVHAARLKNGKEVVIKVIRPDILPIIKADIRLMYRLAHWITRLLPDGKRLRPTEVVLEYEKSLLRELNLLQEAANAIRLRRNFKNSSMLYIPEVYLDYCSEKIMVMERIYGISVNNISALEKQGTNMKLLAERGVQIFFTQIFRDSFFHGDMHPGNILVSYNNPKNPQFISIDFGIVGSLNKEDKHYIAENFIAFFNQDYRKVAELHVKSGWIPEDTNIEFFEFSIRAVCEPVFAKPLSDISFGHLLFNLFNTARRFNMEVQPQLVLLQKTLLYIEGIGRQLYPKLDLWTTAKPFLERWIQDQVGAYAIFRALRKNASYWREKIPELPELLQNSLKQQRMLQKNIDRLILDIKIQNMRRSKAHFLCFMGTTLLLIGTLLIIRNNQTGILAICMMLTGIVNWIISWRRLRDA